MTLCVTFGASRFGPKLRNICTRSECATICTISATAVREVKVSVTFGAPHFGFPVAPCRRPVVDHIAGVAQGSGFSAIAVLISFWLAACGAFLCRAPLPIQMCDDFVLFDFVCFGRVKLIVSFVGGRLCYNSACYAPIAHCSTDRRPRAAFTLARHSLPPLYLRTLARSSRADVVPLPRAPMQPDELKYSGCDVHLLGDCLLRTVLA